MKEILTVCVDRNKVTSKLNAALSFSLGLRRVVRPDPVRIPATGQWDPLVPSLSLPITSVCCAAQCWPQGAQWGAEPEKAPAQRPVGEADVASSYFKNM